LGLEAVRQIDERRNRLKGSEKSYTFHGRDVYAYTGARLAAGQIGFEDVGPELPPAIVSLPYARAVRIGEVLEGGLAQLDFQYGNVWTNIPDALFAGLSPRAGERFQVTLLKSGAVKYSAEMPFAKTFGEVPAGSPLLYLNSLLNLSLALNQGNFSQKNGVTAGGEWTVRIERVAR